ncbi:hypothetical protein B9T33_03735 [Acinetobacter sp. ANC 5054]|uniref:shikimate kinase n=1 Tax=Acinetobacter sp. ANC 5054 TaxID=1977877 RepID=UPI000A331941|nr:shikimate kinase [Acinetobacter sp. ANC 5054]OTG82572.1 hypothetical protein B9T33_03735 [Acinetobacter sp. ANC 5054]
MIIHFIGPGGAGKTTTAIHLAQKIGVSYHDLDQCFLTAEGNISQYINKNSYSGYAIRNIQLYLKIRESLDPTRLNIIVCSSGFMTYQIDICPSYKKIRQEIESNPFTFLLIPSLEIESCTKEIIRRQLKRSYLDSSIEKEEKKIRSRFPIFIDFKCKKILTNDNPENIAEVIYTHLLDLIPLT